MVRRGAEARQGLRCGVWGLAAVVAVMAATADPADARPRRKKAPAYQPPYASIVVDANTGAVLQATQPDARRHPASLTKIMTLYLLFERLESGKLKLTTPLEVSAHAAAQAPTKLGLKPGATIAVEDAIRAVITKSANDAAVVIAEALAGDEETFAEQMTRKARSLGMVRTVYRNASGLPDDEQITTARDQALLGRAIQDRFPRYYKYFATNVFVYRGQSMRNHNKLLGKVEGVDGIKTGFTRASGFNLVTSVRRGNRHIIAVVLGGSSGGARDANMRSLITAHLGSAATKRTVAAITEKPEPRSAQQPQRTAARIAAAAPERTDQNASAIITGTAAPAPGSSEPIQPVRVKTVTFRAAGTQTATLGPPPAAAITSLQLAPVEEPPPPAPRMTLLEPVAATPAPTPITAPALAKPAPAAMVPVAKPSAPPPRPAPEAAKPATNASTPTATSRRAVRSGWIIQVGAYPEESEAKQRLNAAQSKAKQALRGADPFTEPVVLGDKTLYRARFAVFDKGRAENACRILKRNDIACITVKN